MYKVEEARFHFGPPLSLSHSQGQPARQNSPVKRQDVFRDETQVQRESVEVPLSASNHRFSKIMLHFDKYFGRLSASVRVQRFPTSISVSQGQIAPLKYLSKGKMFFMFTRMSGESPSR